jgi:hypothetical protein
MNERGPYQDADGDGKIYLNAFYCDLKQEVLDWIYVI